MTARVRLSRAKGYRKPTDAIVVARPTLFGNPWAVGKHGTRAEVVGNYALLLLGVVAVCRDPDPEEQLEARAHVMANLDKIKAAPAKDAIIARKWADELAYLRPSIPDLTFEQAQHLAPDGPRYKALGNSMAVPVIKWIVDRIGHFYGTGPLCQANKLKTGKPTK